MEEEEEIDELHDGVDHLPQRATLAFYARCALRCLPGFLPDTQNLPDDAARRIRAADACCSIALHTSMDEHAVYRHLAVDAADMLEGPLPPILAAAKACLQYTAMAAGSVDSERLRQTSEILRAYRETGRRFEMVESWEAAARSDLRELRRLALPDAAVVPGPFFARPLFDEPDPSYDRIVERWVEALTRVALSDIGARYVKLYRGGGVPDVNQLSHVTEDWARASRVPQETSSQEHSGRPPTPTVSSVAHQPRSGQTATPASPSTDPSPIDLCMLSDRPLEPPFKERDTLGFHDYADAIATLLNHEETGTPFTMAINAPWGAGKTSLSNMIVAELAQRRKDHGQPPHVICRFNAWMHDDAPNVATAFVSEVSRTANKHRPWFYRIGNPLPTPLLEPGARKRRRLGLLVFAVIAVALGSVWIGEHLQHMEASKSHEASRLVVHQTSDGVTLNADGKETGRIFTETDSRSRQLEPSQTQPANVDWMDRSLTWFQSRMVVLGAFLTAVAGAIGIFAKLLTATPLAGFVQAHDKAVESGSIPAAGNQLKRLIEQSTQRGNRFIVFVDDIERCKPPRAVDVLDAINQLMDHERVMIVLLGDMAAVAAAAQMKYKDLAKIYVPNAGIAIAGADSGKEAFGRLYLQKIIQFQFDLPSAPPATMRRYIEQLAVGGPDGGENVRRAI